MATKINRGYATDTRIVRFLFNGIGEASHHKIVPRVAKLIVFDKSGLMNSMSIYETLKMDLAQARQDKNDIKKTFDNYMIQVEILINQKAVEAPGAKKPWCDFGNFATIILQNEMKIKGYSSKILIS